MKFPTAIRFSEDRVHASYEARVCRALLAHTCSVRTRFFGRFRTVLHRQVQPGPFLLGQL